MTGGCVEPWAGSKQAKSTSAKSFKAILEEQSLLLSAQYSSKSFPPKSEQFAPGGFVKQLVNMFPMFDISFPITEVQ